MEQKENQEKVTLKRFSFLNIITFGLWNRFTPREKGIAIASWNVSSWVTFGQVFAGHWVWTKVSPWLVPAAKSTWAKASFALVALKEAV